MAVDSRVRVLSMRIEASDSEKGPSRQRSEVRVQRVASGREAG